MDCQQLRNCCRPSAVVVIGVVLLLSWTCCMAAGGLQSSWSDERSSLWAIKDSFEPGMDEDTSTGISISGKPLEPNELDRSSPLWELPIITGPACDLSTPTGGGSRESESACHDDTFATSKAGGVPQKGEAEEEKQELVACNVKCFRANPVCGEDAITYWCGAAEAKCARVEVAYKGYCDSRSGGAGKDGSRAAQSLFLVHLLWLALAGFLVWRNDLICDQQK